MLHDLKHLKGFAIHAIDGNIGTIKDFYFDDEKWVVRYLIIETGSWAASRKVLISPMAIKHLNLDEKTFSIALTMDQVKKSPSIDTDKPVSRQHETEHLDYFGYPYYWGDTDLWGVAPSPYMTNYDGMARPNDTSEIARKLAEVETMRHCHDDRHLRSCEAVIGYHIQAIDGDIGHVDGMLMDEKTWSIRYFVINTSNWWIGHQLLIQPLWIKEVNWPDAKVSIGLRQEDVKNAPHYDADVPFNHEQEARVHLYFGPKG
jgi:uncharacterized protein YrrD